MKFFKACIIISICLPMFDAMRKMHIGLTDFSVEPIHWVMIGFAFSVYAIGGYFWVRSEALEFKREK